MRTTSRWAIVLAGLACHAAAVSCAPGDTALSPGPETPGRAVEVTDPNVPPGHPQVPVGEPAAMNGRVGRAAHRLTADQLRASLLAATGFTWLARRTVNDPDAPTGTRVVPEADMLEAMARTLGRPDYVSSTHESIDPAVTFSKLANDAARASCRAAVTADAVIPDTDARRMTDRRIVRHAALSDTAAMQSASVRRNLAYLALRFWGRDLAPDDAQLNPLFRLFDRASTAAAGRDTNGTMRAAATPADGWRAVCIAMATDPQFLTY